MDTMDTSISAQIIPPDGVRDDPDPDYNNFYRAFWVDYLFTLILVIPVLFSTFLFFYAALGFSFLATIPSFWHTLFSSVFGSPLLYVMDILL